MDLRFGLLGALWTPLDTLSVWTKMSGSLREWEILIVHIKIAFFYLCVLASSQHKQYLESFKRKKMKERDRHESLIFFKTKLHFVHELCSCQSDEVIFYQGEFIFRTT
ncbi:hypothetical protein BCV72DRAFT_107781 [Rhizopus microsporus var. microsporus]|uniref:Uncharacterized protein n=1 Tax=Rhizopus microsporus var. microsporus TaxID=86635 RepID=A0A1X0R688_RHIZD|nr:hypothetical protein BCV72DRAFT_107781 [Rhizopus microsporus var. microsporus]